MTIGTHITHAYARLQASRWSSRVTVVAARNSIEFCPIDSSQSLAFQIIQTDSFNNRATAEPPNGRLVRFVCKLFRVTDPLVQHENRNAASSRRWHFQLGG